MERAKTAAAERGKAIGTGGATGAKKRGRPPGRFTQHRRIDKLRHLLEQHPRGLTLYELAEAIGVTPRSMRRYLKEVDRVLDLQAVPTRGGGALRWRVRPGELARKVELRRTQVYALLAARRLFEPMRGSALFDEIDIAVKRLVALAQRPGRGPNAGLADARLEDRFLYLPVAPRDYASRTEELDELFQAVADLRPLRCKYRSLAHDEEAIEIHPYALVVYRDSIYCVGKHLQRGEIRTFLLDRMRDAEASVSERFALPDDFQVEDYFQGEFGIWRSPGKRIKVVVEFEPQVAEAVRARRVHASQKLTTLPGGGVRLTLTVGDLRELSSWLLGWGSLVRVVEPPELVERVRAELETALGRYAPAAAPPVSAGARKRG